MANKSMIGLDIGTSSIKVAIMSHRENPPKLLSLGHIASPQPGIISEADLDLEAVASSIKNLINELKTDTKEVNIALPESKIFTRVVYDLPYLTDAELAQTFTFTNQSSL